jgi:hypothetical protein
MAKDGEFQPGFPPAGLAGFEKPGQFRLAEGPANLKNKDVYPNKAGSGNL